MTAAKIALIGLAVLAVAAVLATQWLSRSVEAKFPPQGKFATVDGVRMHYLDSAPEGGGDLLPMVFLHGASGNARDLHGAFAPALEGRARMIFPDRPGAGYSQRGPQGMEAPDAQARMIAGLMEAIGLPRAVIVGHSLGGAVTAAFALEHPEKTAGLVFLAPATHPWPGGGVTWYYDWMNVPVLGRLFAETLAVPLGNLLYRSALREVFRPDRVPPAYPERSGTRLVLRPDAFRHNAADVGSLYDHVRRLAPRYGEIAAPTVVVTGDSDSVVLARIHSEGLERDIGGARLVWLEETGHMPPYTETGAIVAEIERLNGEINALAAR